MDGGNRQYCSGGWGSNTLQQQKQAQLISFKDAWFNGFTKDFFYFGLGSVMTTMHPMIDRYGTWFDRKRGPPLRSGCFTCRRLCKERNQIKFTIPEGIKFEKVDVHYRNACGWSIRLSQ